MPAELDNMDPEMDQEMDASADMGSDPAAMGAEGGQGDQEGAMAKQELIKLANYATNLQEHIEDDEQLEAWVQSKITIAATNIASVYHYLAYEKKIGEYGEALDSAPMSESKRRALTGWLMEAKAKVKELKKAQAEKMSEEFTDKSKVGDTFKTKTGVATKTDTGMKHTNTSYHDDGDADEKSGKGIKTHAKAKDAETKKSEKANDIKLPKHSGNTWGMKGGEKFGQKMEEAAKAKKDYDQDGKVESGKDEYLGSKIRAAKKAGKLKEGTCSVCKKDPCACKKEKKCNKCGMYESKCGCSMKESAKPSAGLSKAKKSAVVKEAAKWRDPKHKDKLYTQEPRDPDDYYQSDDDYYNPKPDDYPGAKNLKGGSEYRHNDPLRAGYGRYGVGSLNTHGKRKGMPSRDHITSLKGSIKDAHGKHPHPNLPEAAKPSAGLSKAKKSAVVKDAKAGKDIGKPGKSFDKVAKSAGGGEKGKKIAAAAMWKNIKETTAYVAEKKNLPGKQEKLDADKDGKLEKSDFAALRAGKKETVKESADLTRMRELTSRLNVHEKTRLNENDEVNSLRKLSNFLKG